MSEDAIDGFAGPGGWDEAARQLGLDPLGIEIDDAACATRKAAGLRTLQADICELDPMQFAPVRVAIFSPPCQAFSQAGSGAGRRALGVYVEAVDRTVEGKPPSRAELDEACEDERAHLVLEPLRWVMALEPRPQVVALEQVDTVLPLWEKLAWALRLLGYFTWTGILSAERYGVPQTRKRAILMASLVRQPAEPRATHARYVAPRKPRQEESLFDPPDPKRIVLPEDRGLQPWISMAEALGWPTGAMVQHRRGGERLEEEWSADRPSDAVTSRTDRWQVGDLVGFPRRADTPSNRASGRIEIDGVEYRERDFRRASEPALTVTEKARSAVRIPSHVRSSCQEHATVRSVDEPAPTITGANSGGITEWEYDSRQQRDTRSGDAVFARRRSVDEPAPTIAGESRNDSWVRARDAREGGPRDPDWPSKRPATTVAGDPRLAQPGHKNEEAMPDCPGRMEGAIRVDVREVAVLQGFRADYPWQGTRTAIYRQIGDAVPPGLARAVLAELLR